MSTQHICPHLLPNKSGGDFRGPGHNWAFSVWAVWQVSGREKWNPRHPTQQLRGSFYKPLAHKGVYDGVQAAVTVSKGLSHCYCQPNIAIQLAIILQCTLFFQKVQEKANVIWSPEYEKGSHYGDDQLNSTVFLCTPHVYQGGDDPSVASYHHQQRNQ